MPNWCNNEIEITGSKEAIDGIMKIILDGNDDSIMEDGEMNWYGKKGLAGTIACPNLFSVLMPEPDGYESKDGWQRDMWGTKWDVSACVMSRDGDTISIGCQTAWSPAGGVYQHIIENHEVSLVCRYEESGMEFMGEWRGEWEEGGTGEGAFYDEEYTLQNRTNMGGEVPRDWIFVGDEVVGDLLYYTSEDTIKDGEPMRQVLGLMKGNGWIDKFGDIYDELDISIEVVDGEFHIPEWEIEDIDAWMQNAITEEVA